MIKNQIIKHKKFLYWLVSTCSALFAVAIAHQFDLWQSMHDKDITKISWLICAVSAVSVVYMGVLSAKPEKSNPVILNRLWFVSDAMITLGMIGTVAGFLIMLGDSFGNINVTDPAEIQKTIQMIGVGMGTSLITTLVGLVGSLLLKLQLVVFENEE